MRRAILIFLKKDFFALGTFCNFYYRFFPSVDKFYFFIILSIIRSPGADRCSRIYWKE